MKMRVLINGSSGFVGKHVQKAFAEEYEISTVSLRGGIQDSNLKDDHVEVVLHLAGKAHQMGETDEQEYYAVNRDLARDFAIHAKEKNVKHFIYISSTKVYGDKVSGKLDEFSVCEPDDPYGESKYLAEQDLLKLSDSQFKVAIIRPPLIYGEGVKGNLSRIIGLVKKLPFLPFGGINNKRSMVYVGNLAALIDHIIKKQAEGVFIAGDDRSYSTTELVESIVKHLGIQKKNVALPRFLKRIIKVIKPSIYVRLFESYEVDNSKTNTRLNFTPPFTFDEGIKEMIS